jgi:hypothetical protein
MTELLAALQDSALSIWVRESSSLWAYPMVITMHTFGLGVLVGASTAVDLRVLGVARQIPLASLRGVFAAMWIGFWLNAVTGVLLFAADPRTTGLFMIKLGAVAAGVVLIVLIRRAMYGQSHHENSMVTPVAKTYAVLSLLAWVVATTTGRLMAYL